MDRICQWSVLVAMSIIGRQRAFAETQEAFVFVAASL